MFPQRLGFFLPTGRREKPAPELIAVENGRTVPPFFAVFLLPPPMCPLLCVCGWRGGRGIGFALWQTNPRPHGCPDVVLMMYSIEASKPPVVLIHLQLGLPSVHCIAHLDCVGMCSTLPQAPFANMSHVSPIKQSSHTMPGVPEKVGVWKCACVGCLCCL